MSGENTEYQAEYDKAMAELEAAAEGTQPEATTAKVEDKIEEPEQKPEEAAAPEAKVDDPLELKRQLEEAQEQIKARDKALQDTQRWAHENARKLKEIEKANRQKPELLQSIPELEEAVRFVRETDAEQQQETQQEAYQQALGIVFNAHPDAPELLSTDPEFYKAMEARREAVGAEKFDTNPAVMIREITAEKLERAKRAFEAEKQAAIEAARKDAEKAAKAKASMTMPGAAAGSGRTSSSQALTAEEVWNMSPEAFQRMTSKVTGF